MAGAYTPGLTVSGDIIVRRVRRLPIKGEVLVSVGDDVQPETTIARAKLPGILQTVKLADKLGVEPKDVASFLKVELGTEVKAGDLIAEGKKLFGIFKAPTVHSDHSGTVESVSDVTGNMLVREPAIPIDMNAYVTGKVVEILPDEGAVVETRGAMVQGIFGIGGERTGVITVVVSNPDEVLDAKHIPADANGKILVGGSGVTAAAIRKASEVGVKGLIAGGVKDSDLIEFLGYDIGVAITGQENISLTLMVTEGFGFLPMAGRTFELLKSLEGKTASMNGATQIRAGVIRPEIIVPGGADASSKATTEHPLELKVGTPIRVIREPYFGQIGKVTELPAELVTLDSGTTVRVLRAELASGEAVTVPRANVEIIAVS